MAKFLGNPNWAGQKVRAWLPSDLRSREGAKPEANLPAYTNKTPLKKHANGEGKRRKKRVCWSDQGRELCELDLWDFEHTPAFQAEVLRARSAKKATEKRWGSKKAPKPCALELSMLDSPTRSTAHIVNTLVKDTARGLEFGAQVMHCLTHASFEGGRVSIEAKPVRRPDHPTARRMLRLLLVVLQRLTRSREPDELSVRGAGAWWGKQIHFLGLSDEQIEERMRERNAMREDVGKKALPRCRFAWGYRRVRNAHGRHQQHGLAKAIDGCVRTVARYLKAFRLCGVIRSYQPKAGSVGAVMPKRIGSLYAYPTIALCEAPPESLMKRLQRWWGERRKKGDYERPNARPEPRQHERAPERRAAAPPGDRLAAQPTDAETFGLSPSEFDDLEQLCGIPF